MARRRNAAREARRAARRAPRPPDAPSPWPFVGMGLMAASLFLHGASVLVAPWWGVVLLLVLWVAAFVVCVRWWTPHPRRVPLVAVVSVGVWFVVLLVGAVLGGW
ncbi:hypothetical protein ENKNEFLB_02623 [Nocardioides aquaticus]|uniref:DUF4175 domain-containing protein n=1 Tax=Nocardioides aquaticus TaxID=160826 RepID=A0ABX8EI91_9ACTN|nr:hypothetical protein [Nocardioides aquaticus]QVT80232.1 hypothetical protein ENKNEFLB_02623 [Nocardioides aquaticus]